MSQEIPCSHSGVEASRRDSGDQRRPSEDCCHETSKDSPSKESAASEKEPSRSAPRMSHRFLPWINSAPAPSSKHVEKLAKRRLRSSRLSEESLPEEQVAESQQFRSRDSLGSSPAEPAQWAKNVITQELAGLDDKLTTLTQQVDRCLNGISDIQRLHLASRLVASEVQQPGPSVLLPQSQWSRGCTHQLLAQPQQHESEEEAGDEMEDEDIPDEELESEEKFQTRNRIVLTMGPHSMNRRTLSLNQLLGKGIESDTPTALPDCRGSSERSTTQDRFSLPECSAASGRRYSLRSSCSMTSSIMDSATLRHHISRLVVKRSRNAEYMWQFLEEPQPKSVGSCFATMTPFIILASVFLTLWQTTQWHVLQEHRLRFLEFGFDSLFTLEVVLRFWCCPDRWAFFQSPYNWIDLSAALPPLVLRVVYELELSTAKADSVGLGQDFLISFAPVLRLLKLLRRFEQFHLLLSAFRLAFEALPVLLFTLSVIVLFFSSLIYLTEPRDNIQSLPKAMWLTIVTIGTIGYGDSVPSQTAGHIVVSILIGFSALYMAIPLGIVGKAFGDVWEDRSRLLLLQRFRSRLWQRGYHAQDVPQLFHVFDRDKDGEMSFDEFQHMLEEIRIGIDATQVQSLFLFLDVDRSGRISDYEFVRSVFPKDHERIYGVSERMHRSLSAQRSVMEERSTEQLEEQEVVVAEEESLGS